MTTTLKMFTDASPAAIKTYILDQCEDLLVMLNQHGLQPDDAADAHKRALKLKALINCLELKYER